MVQVQNIFSLTICEKLLACWIMGFNIPS